MGQKIKQTEIKEVIRSVVRENIKEVTTNDWHFKAIMSIWDNGGSFTRKKLGTLICRDTNAKRSDIEAALRDTDYSEITDFTDRLRIEGITESVETLNNELMTQIKWVLKKLSKANLSQPEIQKYTKIKNDTLEKLNSPHLIQYRKMKRAGNVESVNEGEDNIPGGLAKGMTLNDIAEKHGVSVDVLVAEFKKGIQTEMEHTTDREVAKEITLDHLFEDPQYYTKLSSVEEYVDDKGVEHVAAALPQTEEEPIKEEDEPEETLKGLKEMAMGDLERIADYAKMILERMASGQELDSWMYSQITLAVDQLNSVHDTMDGNDGVKESVNEEKVYIDYLNKQKGFKQDRIKFNSYEEAVKWARKNFEKFNPDMIKYESVVTEGTEPEVITKIKTIAKNHQHDVVVDPKSGKKMKVDAFSASAIATVYDALSDSNKEKFVSSGLLGMQSTAMKLLKR